MGSDDEGGGEARDELGHQNRLEKAEDAGTASRAASGGDRLEEVDDKVQESFHAQCQGSKLSSGRGSTGAPMQPAEPVDAPAVTRAQCNGQLKQRLEIEEETLVQEVAMLDQDMAEAERIAGVRLIPRGDGTFATMVGSRSVLCLHHTSSQMP